VKAGDGLWPGNGAAARLDAVTLLQAMQAPLDSEPDLVPLIGGSLTGLVLAALLLASGLVRIGVGVPLLVGSGDPHDTTRTSAIRP
jgi:hypothetical protein